MKFEIYEITFLSGEEFQFEISLLVFGVSWKACWKLIKFDP